MRQTDALQRVLKLREKPNVLPGHDLHWFDWLTGNFDFVCTHGFAPRHESLWDWLDALERGVKPRARVDVWPRGGAKSSTAELGCARVCVRNSRSYVLYVCGTQDQADKHVGSVAALLESLSIPRSVNVYGHSRGWRRQELRTANGFNVSGIGLDAAVRGVKLDQYRPDLIILDDVDNQTDTPETVEKKISAITTAILPAGSSDCAVLVIQNKIHEDSIVSQLCDGRADFLHGREAAHVEPAVHNLTFETEDRGDGLKEYRITGGEATWEGQSLPICEMQINEWGLKAFLREAQHEVEGADGYVFNVSKINYVDLSDVPELTKYCRAWDLAATEGGGDRTVGWLSGLASNGAEYVLDVQFGQWGSDNVRTRVISTAATDKLLYGKVITHLPQDPAQAGVDQATQYDKLLGTFPHKIESVNGKKATRASGYAEKMNAGNTYWVRAGWNSYAREEFRKFREDEKHPSDDFVDAASDAHNEIDGKLYVSRPSRRGTVGGTV